MAEAYSERPLRRDGWVELGMAVSALSAAVSSFAGLRELAMVAGWAPAMAWLFPLTVDAYAMTATRVWLAASTRSVRARRFARINAVGAIAMSLAGNAAWHLVAARLIVVTWPIVLGVGAVPPLVLGLVSHLAVLRTERDRAERVTAEIASGPLAAPPAPVRRSSPPQDLESEDGPRPEAGTDLLEAARAADLAYRAEHGARPITRDALRQALHISGTKATALLRELKEQASQAKNG
jgi:hypothetical protein